MKEWSLTCHMMYFVQHKFTIFGITTFITKMDKPTLAWSLVPSNHNHHHHHPKLRQVFLSQIQRLNLRLTKAEWHVLRLCADQLWYRYAVFFSVPLFELRIFLLIFSCTLNIYQNLLFFLKWGCEGNWTPDQ